MQPDTDADLGRLARELARQALLAVAREDFGLITRDVALGEVALEDNAAEASIELHSQLGADSDSGTAILIIDAETHAGPGGKGKESRIVVELPVGCVPPSFAEPWRGPGVGRGLEETVVAMVDTSQDILAASPRPWPHAACSDQGRTAS